MVDFGKDYIDPGRLAKRRPDPKRFGQIRRDLAQLWSGGQVRSLSGGWVRSERGDWRRSGGVERGREAAERPPERRRQSPRERSIHPPERRSSCPPRKSRAKSRRSGTNRFGSGRSADKRPGSKAPPDLDSFGVFWRPISMTLRGSLGICSIKFNYDLYIIGDLRIIGCVIVYLA